MVQCLKCRKDNWSLKENKPTCNSCGFVAWNLVGKVQEKKPEQNALLPSCKDCGVVRGLERIDNQLICKPCFDSRVNKAMV